MIQIEANLYPDQTCVFSDQVCSGNSTEFLFCPFYNKNLIFFHVNMQGPTIFVVYQNLGLLSHTT